MSTGRKRVLFLVPAFAGGGGGAERVISILLRHLDRTKFELHLGVIQERSAVFQDIPDDVIVHDLRVSRMRYALLPIINLLWKVRPQTVLSTVVYLNVLLVLARPFLPRVKLLLREATIPSAFIAQQARHPRVWRWFYRHLYKRADSIICLSDFMLKDLAEQFGLPQEKLIRIYNPVDVDYVRRSAESFGNPYSGDGPHLVTVGRLQREKGLDVLLEAMPGILQAFPMARLAVLGEGPLEAELKAQIRKLGLGESVNFLGFQPNPCPYLKYADLFVLPSRVEGMPNALLEALALGKDVVASDCPGGVREIQDAVKSMVLVPPEDPQALAEAIIAALQSPSSSRTGEGLGRFKVQTAIAEYSALL
ncbi:MAG: hypothetical protein DMG65_09795 [Candidatus Angelobacter sp. Gp1-AA117]|nr:MAG: hypothetical protein DMG65_09795 [Candidatus Angelobacter sp. Gp1-AA117]